MLSGEISGWDTWAMARVEVWMAAGKWMSSCGGCCGEGENPW